MADGSSLNPITHGSPLRQLYHRPGRAVRQTSTFKIKDSRQIHFQRGSAIWRIPPLNSRRPSVLVTV
jgi:hypothetical protein